VEILHNVRVRWAFWALALSACAPHEARPPIPVAIEQSDAPARLPSGDSACAPLRGVVDAAAQALAERALERLGPPLLALADDLGERHVERPALVAWRGAFRAQLYQIALGARIATTAADRADGEARAAARAWTERLIAEEKALASALFAHCDDGVTLAVEASVDAPPEGGLILTETDEAYRLQGVARRWLAAYGARADDEVAYLERMRARIARVKASQPEIGGEASCERLAGEQDEATRAAHERACDEFGTASACAALGREEL